MNLGKSGLLESRIKDGAVEEWITNTGCQPVNDSRSVVTFAMSLTYLFALVLVSRL